MNFRKSILSTVFAASLTLGGVAALAQDATPDADADATPVEYLTVQPKAIKTVDGTFAGTVTLWEDADGVSLVVKSASGELLEPGDYVVHVHENGVCDTDGENAFESAGAHVNTGDDDHEGAHSDDEMMTVEDDGSFEYWGTLHSVTLNPDEENSLNDADGSAIVIHSGTDADDEDESRVACGVIFAPLESGMAATPEATPAD